MIWWTDSVVAYYYSVSVLGVGIGDKIISQKPKAGVLHYANQRNAWLLSENMFESVASLDVLRIRPRLGASTAWFDSPIIYSTALPLPLSAVQTRK